MFPRILSTIGIIAFLINGTLSSVREIKLDSFEKVKEYILANYIPRVKREIAKKYRPVPYLNSIFDSENHLDVLFVSLDPKQVMDGFGGDDDDFFLLQAFFKYDSSRFLVFPNYRPLDCIEKTVGYKEVVIKSVIRNLKKFILKSLAKYQSDDEKKAFLDSVDLFYKQRLYRIIRQVFGFKEHEANQSCHDIQRDFESSLFSYYSLIAEDIERIIARKFGRFYTGHLKDPLLKPSDHLGCLFYYFTQFGLNFARIRWLSRQPAQFLLYYFLFQRYPFYYGKRIDYFFCPEGKPLIDLVTENFEKLFPYVHFHHFQYEGKSYLSLSIKNENSIPIEMLKDSLSFGRIQLENLLKEIFRKCISAILIIFD
jgi:hypothetical protein